MSSKKKIFGVILALLVSTIMNTGIAYGGYSAIYLDRSPRSTSKVIFTTVFDIDDPTELDQSASLMSVMSSVGGYGSGSTGGNGWAYQNVIACWDDGEVYYCPQAWKFSPPSSAVKDWSSVRCLADSFEDDWELYVAKMETNIANEEIDFKWYAYETSRDVELDAYIFDSYSGDAHEDDHNFVVGDRTDTYHYRYTQVGVESATEINGTDWKIQQQDIGYKYSGDWKYDPGRTTTGTQSVIVCDGGDSDTAILICGSEYRGVTIDNSADAMVRWENNQASRISDDTSVWTGSGDLSPPVSGPYD